MERQESAVRTPKQLAMIVGAYFATATLFGLTQILLLVHEAIRVEAGKGESLSITISMVFIAPLIGGCVGIAAGACAEFYLANQKVKE